MTLLLAIVIIAITLFLILKGYQTQATLFLSGFALLIVAHLLSSPADPTSINQEGSPTGWFGFDLFDLVAERFSSRVAGIGMIIMAAGGFARYLSHIHASQALVQLSIRPLAPIKSPYLLLALSYIVGQLLNIFIPSAAGLAMLLLVAMFPTLLRLGVRPAAAAAVIGTTACLDLGPASAGSNVAATVAGLSPTNYFVSHQLPIALVTIPAIALLHYFWQKRCDASEPPTRLETLSAPENEQAASSPVPFLYAFLPLLPLFLLIIFSPLGIKSIQIDVVPAMFVSLFVGMGCEAIRLRSLKDAMQGIVVFLKGMGEIFSKVVSLVIAAEVFAIGVKASGLIDILIDNVESTGMGGIAMTIALVLIIGFIALLTGSGNASLFSFANMIPGIAKPMGLSSLSMILPSQLAAGLFRSFSPVAGVIIAVSNAADTTPLAIAKRTSVPMIGGVLVMLLAHWGFQ
ncbi:transporter, DcuC family [Verrucomicrobiia bacterium DG1235]|nr:transporter, DcuC family [Verrucomicrobiae bacterium DG1235]